MITETSASMEFEADNLAPEGNNPTIKTEGRFTFQKCQDENLRIRVETKQSAVDDALKHIEAICGKLRIGTAGIEDGERDAFDLVSGSEIKAWLRWSW